MRDDTEWRIRVQGDLVFTEREVGLFLPSLVGKMSNAVNWISIRRLPSANGGWYEGLPHGHRSSGNRDPHGGRLILRDSGLLGVVLSHEDHVCEPSPLHA